MNMDAHARATERAERQKMMRDVLKTGRPSKMAISKAALQRWAKAQIRRPKPKCPGDWLDSKEFDEWLYIYRHVTFRQIPEVHKAIKDYIREKLI